MSAGAGSRDLLSRARAFLEGEVDEADRAELARLVDAAVTGDTEAWKELAGRFQGAPGFGTAGIRGVLGAGESRMNRGLVLRVTHGLVSYLLESVPGTRERGVVLARDGRRSSDVFQKDAASVLAAAGVPVHWIEGPQPTPLLAFAVKHLAAAAGVMVTASHNPPEYNGYKVYWENAAQIVPPIDAGIAAAIERAPPPREVPRAPDSELVERLEGIDVAYLDAIAKLGFGPSLEDAGLRVAYSALHGCGQRLFLEAMKRRGLVTVFPVREQAEPDGRFPTVRFPNPEEPGALDLSLTLARAERCDVVLVNDPDADRLGVAVRREEGDYAVLNGNEIGALLGDYVLSTAAEVRPLVVSTIVSSRLLSKLAGERGARYADTLTGFKWIVNEALRLEAEEGVAFVFGFEEALGYTVGTAVRDKDGIGAGVVFAEMAAALKREGRSPLDVLHELWTRHGLHASRQRSVGLEGAEDALEKLRAHAGFELGEEQVTGIWDLSASTYRHANGTTEERGRNRSDVLVFDLADGGRVAVRPSGTEPKLKLYLEVVEPFEDEARAQEAAAQRLDALERELRSLGGIG